SFTRVLVSSETSCASRSAFETVITETWARAAMSFRRIMVFSDARSSPMQLQPQRFAKRGSCQMQQPDRAPAAANRDGFAQGKLTDDFPIGAQNGCRFGAVDFDLNPR